MTKIFVFLSLSFVLACNFSIDPRNAGDDKRDATDPSGNQLFYSVAYQEVSKTIDFTASTSRFLLEGDFLAEYAPMVKDPEREMVWLHTKSDVEPADLIETSVSYQGKGGPVVNQFSIPRITIEEIPLKVSRASGFDIKIGGAAIAKSDFIDLELYDPETKESVAFYSLQPSIPGMEETVAIDGNTLKISSGFMAWFSEFESGKTYLLSINRSPGGWSKEKNLDYVVNYQIKYSSAHQSITVIP